MSGKTNIKRRDFIKAASVAMVAAPTIVPSTVFGQNAPSNRITVGHIGVGSQGSSDLNAFLGRDDCQCLAVCDVWKEHRDRAKNRVESTYAKNRPSGSYKGCDAYNGFEDIIARDDIDAIVIALPYHWHAIPTIMAANAGKHIYGEKPVGRTVSDGRAMVEAVRRNGITFQVGSQQRSDENFRFACELVRNEKIGKLHTAFVGLPSFDDVERKTLVEMYPDVFRGEDMTGKAIDAEMPVPEGLDYDRWLGPAPKAPYHVARVIFNWRWIMDYGSGRMGDWVNHHCDIAHWGMNTCTTGPVEVEGYGEYPRTGLWNAVTSWHYECTYANGLKMIMDDVPYSREGIRFVGDEGWVFVGRSTGIDAEPKSLLTSMIKRDEIHLYKSLNHHGNFIDCVKSGEEPIVPIEEGHRSTTISTLGHAAMILGRKLKWDPENEHFVNDAEADRMLSHPYRSPWRLPQA